MKPSLVKLHKFFKLEAERGYDNHAVLGGLDRMLERWEAEARAENIPEDLVKLVVSRVRDYPRLSANSRVDILTGLINRIQRLENGLPPLDENAPEITPLVPVEHKSEHIETPAELADFETPESLPMSEKPEAEQSRRVLQSPTPPWNSEPSAMDAPVTVLSGIGPRHAQTLNRLNITTLRDMLYHFPRRYDDYSQLKPINRLNSGEEVTVIGTVQSSYQRPIRSGKVQLFEAIISDGSGTLRVTWFNQPWIAKRLRSGVQIVLSGKISQYLGRPVMENPEWEPLEQQQLSTNRIVPVYPLTAQITQRWLRRQMNQIVTYWAPRVLDPLPAKIRQSAGVIDLPRALLQIHFPDSQGNLTAAQERLAFDEIFLLQLGLLNQRRAWKERPARTYQVESQWLQNQIDRLPYPLTGAQQRALDDIRHDLASGHPMNRLLQGDVGSGKTVVAALACLMIAQSKAQAAFMAPTSILAEQHYKNLLKLLAEEQPAREQSLSEVSPAENGTELAYVINEDSGSTGAILPPLRPDEIRLLLGATPEATKQEIRTGLADGSIRLIIGTHALIEEPVIFNNLQLVIVDEQHRFGVEQRATLRAKGENPHLLVMTATPIPRSLALTVFGDLDLSIMDEMPPGRKPVSTHVLAPRERERAYTLIQRQVESGRQVFVIYPLIGDKDNPSEEATDESRAAVTEHARLQQQVFPQFKLGLLHGRLRPDEKDAVMAHFRDGDYQILVSTTVVEVGVDVPNATVMLIEGAERFGLAQLHQLRGRVGRGADKSYCLLITETPDAVENERLRVMEQTNDGFELAEKDLQQRGPGQFLGTRQAGISDIQMANLTNIRLIEKARRQAQQLFEEDPALSKPEHQAIETALRRFWSEGKGDVS